MKTKVLLMSALLTPIFLFAAHYPLHSAASTHAATPQRLGAVGDTTLVSESTGGSQGDRYSMVAAVSDTGRFVTFLSDAENLVAGDENFSPDIFVHDRVAKTTNRVSVSSSGAEADSRSIAGATSADGNYVVFISGATNLVQETGTVPVLPHQLYLRDRAQGETVLISAAPDGTPGDDTSAGFSFSADLRYIAFASGATNLVANDTNNAWDVFVYDRQSTQMRRISMSSSGTPGNADSQFPVFSANGRYVVFHSDANNLVTSDDNGRSDLFLHNMQTGQTTRVSVDGEEIPDAFSTGGFDLSADGRYLAFTVRGYTTINGNETRAPEVYLRDLQSGATRHIAKEAYGPSITANGGAIVFTSNLATLVANDTNDAPDIFLLRCQGGRIVRISVASDGSQSNPTAIAPLGGAAIAKDGGTAVFVSNADDLTAGDSNETYDVFAHELAPSAGTGANCFGNTPDPGDLTNTVYMPGIIK